MSKNYFFYTLTILKNHKKKTEKNLFTLFICEKFRAFFKYFNEIKIITDK